jgi:hypothetical protein
VVEGLQRVDRGLGGEARCVTQQHRLDK